MNSFRFQNKTVLSGLLGMCILATPSIATDYLLDVPVVKQDGDLWCWAAVDHMVMTFHHLGQPQCTIASNALGIECCPLNDDNRVACDITHDPTVDSYEGFEVTERDGSLTMAEVIDQYSKSRPFIFTWIWDGTVEKHYMVGVGYRDIPGTLPSIGYNNSNGNGSFAWVKSTRFSSQAGVYYSGKTYWEIH